MSIASPELNPSVDWRTISLLNAVSALSQIAQFGIAFMVLPIWLTLQGVNAMQLGLFDSALWLGMLPGLIFAPRLSARYGPRAVILAGLLASIIGLLIMPFSYWPLWLPAGALAGLGMGLRWIGLEPWLYHIAPSHARGRVVGFHETLIGLAPIIAPALAGWAGVNTRAPFALGIGFLCAAIIPLAFSRHARQAAFASQSPDLHIAARPANRLLALGIAIALVGGLTDAAFAGLFPLFGAGRALSVGQIAALLSVFGLGGLLLQYAVGWLADHRGLAYTTLVCAGGTVVTCVIMAFPVGFLLLNAALFLLGGCITAFLTLAIIAATSPGSGNLSSNVSRISITYTASAVFGPLAAGSIMRMFGSQALVWHIGGLAALLCAYMVRSGHFERAAP